MEPTAQIQIIGWLWFIPLLPLIGFLFNAVAGSMLVKAPKPVVETEEAQLAASLADPHRYEIEPEHDPAHDGQATADDHGHGGHDHANLDKGGMGIVGGIATLTVVLAFVLSIIVALPFFGGAKDPVVSTAFDWMKVPAMAGLPGLDLSFRLMVDPLTVLMLLIITGVGALIHLYSIAYMAGDKGFARYFAYLNLFIFFMLLLVMGSNLIVTFVGWEGVGLASYLLIGYWADRVSAATAGKKAFIVNRIGDFAFLIALFLIFKYFGTFELYGQDGILSRVAAGNWPADYIGVGLASVSTIVPLLLLIGAAGKSAQVPLYVWLPDAMEGPTPVSALIHAATMVTGGVFLLSRLHLLLLASPEAMIVITVVGIVTAFLAATIALAQNDIKKVLAYSTVSQLGYMFVAVGTGAFGAAMFHVMTHAFFKALLFLGSGSVIHAMGGEQDMRKMGGLASKLPVTYWTMWIGTAAIAGIPPLAGFWSKDEILLNAIGPMGGFALWATGWFVAGMTAFYMVRMMMKTFLGQPRHSEDVAAHVHESPAIMTVPLLILAGLSVIGGFFNAEVPTPALNHGLEKFLGESVAWREKAGVPFEPSPLTIGVLMGFSIVVAVGGCFLAYYLYSKSKNGSLLADDEREGNVPLTLLENKWWVDEFYDRILVQPGRHFATFLWRTIDVRALDNGVTGVGRVITGFADALKNWQSGYVRNYALSMFLGIVFIVLLSLIAVLTAQAK